MKYERLTEPNFLDIFLHRLKNYPDRVVLKYLDEKGKQEEALTYRKIDERAKSIGRYLKRKTNTGDRIGLMYAHSPEFIFTYMGCLYAGNIPVPLNVPFRRQAVKRMRAILEDSGLKIIFTTRKLHRYLWFSFLFKKVKLVNSNRINKEVSTFEYPELSGNDIALLQYTSGSTGRPKGVVVRHSNMLANLEQISQAIHIHSDIKSVSWLPSFHDMGFIAGYMLPVWANSQSIMMSPLDFIKKPLTWINAIDRHQADFTFLPNFGLGISAAKISDKDLEGVNLTQFNQVYCGSEPVRKSTIDKFVQRFEQTGFNEDSIYPCYGMAEATLMITIGEKGDKLSYLRVSTDDLKKGWITEVDEHHSRSLTLFSCGRPWGDTKIAIVNPETQKLNDIGEIGEIWVHGSIVTGEYWEKPQVNEEVFNAEIPETGEKGYLRTGDLGALVDDQLYVTGRLKDLIIIRGQNYYPHDLESVLQNLHPAMRINNCSIFSIDGDGRELIVVLQEIRKKQEGKYESNELFELIRGTLAKEFSISPDTIVLIPQGTLPKTTSGKIQRFQCRNLYLNGHLKILDQWKQRDTLESLGDAEKMSLEDFLKHLIARKTGHSHEDLDLHEKVFNYGVDSLMVVEITDLLEERTKKSLSPNIVWEKETIAAICKEIKRS